MKNDRAMYLLRPPRWVSRRRIVPSRVCRTRGLRVLLLGLSAVFLLVSALIFAPAVRAAAGDFVFIGRGWGHGVGMSQWGAWQAAKEGVKFDDILAFYYPGTTLEPMSNPDTELKVRISSKPWTSNTTNFVEVDLKPTVTAANLVKHGSSGDDLEAIPVGSVVTVLCSGGKVQVTTAAGSQGPYDYIEMRPLESGAGAAEGRVAIQLRTSSASIDYREYWGTIRVQPGDDSGELWVYNFVPVEKYVRSIAEVDYDWAMPGSAAYAPEAVKAQAVAARTYAVAKNDTLADNQNDQCYRGYTFEAQYPGIALAAEETAGLILTYQGKPITAYFSAHSGGYTTNSAWSGATQAYIVPQPDPWSLRAPPTSQHSEGPGWNWTYTISAEALSAKVNGNLKDTTGKTVNVGLLARVEIIGRDTADPTSHAKTLRLTGSGGTATVSVLSFRTRVGSSNLLSTLILNITGGEPLPPGEFYDVGLNHQYHDQIYRMVESGLMNGYESGLFKPYDSVTRWQFAKIAVNLHNLTRPEDRIAVVDATVSPFGDVPVKIGVVGDESDWIAAAKNAGLVSGVTSTSFAPYVVILRDQMATMMCRALGWEDEAEALPGDTVGFADVTVNNVHWAAATLLKVRGIIQGYPNPDGGEVTVLRVAEAIKRQHVAVILCRLLDLEL